MITTSIHIEEDLKARVAVAAKRSGKTAHAFILHARAQGQLTRKPAARKAAR